jgi:hypothetical protein
VRVALSSGLESGAWGAAAAAAAHAALRTLAPAAYAARAPAPLRRIAATVLVLGGAWRGANVGYARATLRWNGEG